MKVCFVVTSRDQTTNIKQNLLFNFAPKGEIHIKRLGDTFKITTFKMSDWGCVCVEEGERDEGDKVVDISFKIYTTAC